MIERYSPYETLLEIATADDLNDTSLAASFPLHTASPSTSSSRLQLHEISEDGEDTGPPRRPTSMRANTGSIFGTQRYKLERRVDQIMRSDSPARASMSYRRFSADSTSLPVLPSSPPTPKASLSQYLVTDESGLRSVTDLSSQPSVTSTEDKVQTDELEKEQDAENASEASIPGLANEAAAPDLPQAQVQEVSYKGSVEQIEEAEVNRLEFTVETDSTERSVPRTSLSKTLSFSERPKFDYDEPYDFSKFEALKPKVKLGPRPVAAGERTKASVATLPVNLSKKQEQSRPKSQSPLNLPAPAFAPAFVPPPIPDTPAYNPRPLSRGSIKSVPSQRSTTMTPDKLRLMKAVELQKRKLRKSNHPQQQPPELRAATTDAPNVPEIVREESAQDEDQPLTAVEMQPSAQDLAAQQRNGVEEIVPPQKGRLQKENADTGSRKPDSGIEMGYPRSEQEGFAMGNDESKLDEEMGVHLSHSPDRLSHASEAQLTSGTPDHKPELGSEEALVATAPDIKDTLHSQGAVREDASEVSPFSEIPQGVAPSVDHGPTMSKPASADAPTINTYEDEVSPLVEEIAGPAASETVSPLGTEDFEDQTPVYGHKEIRLAKRRRGIVAPIRTDDSAEGLGGEEFMDEMQEATVHDAQSMTVAKSPIAEVLPRDLSAMSGASAQPGHCNKEMGNRSSIPIDRFYESSEMLTPNAASPPTSRTPSTLTGQNASPNVERADPMAGRKRNVSSGITKRIQALAEHSSRDPSPTDRHSPSGLPSPDPAQGVVGERKASFKNVPRARGSYFTKRRSAKFGAVTSPDVPPGSPMPSPPVWNVQHDASTNRDSVSVTAKIVRPQSRQKSDVPVSSEGEFQHSELFVNHNRAAVSPTKAPEPGAADIHAPVVSPTKSDFTSASQAPPSPTAARPPQGTTRQLHSSNRLSFGRHRTSPVLEDAPPTPTMAQSSSATSLLSNDENAPPKEGTRTSRFFKRMSNIGGGGKRKSIAQQSMGSTLNVAGIGDGHSGAACKETSDKPSAATVGDLNIQFPDNLVRIFMNTRATVLC